MSNTLGGNQPISRSGSARSFNTTFGRPTATTPSPRMARAHLGGGQQANSLPGSLFLLRIFLSGKEKVL